LNALKINEPVHNPVHVYTFAVAVTSKKEKTATNVPYQLLPEFL